MSTSDSDPTPSRSGIYELGTVLAERYRIVERIARGGMGEVYQAYDLVLDQTVALKFLPSGLAAHPEGYERFRREVRLARTVTHPNVARVHDIGEVDGRAFLTMEFVDGEDLGRLLKRIGRLPREKAVEIARQICAGVAAAHEQGVLHRDLKPANVMLDAEGRVRLTDFGLASAIGDEGAGGGIPGTPAYMAPEQLFGRPTTVQSEIFSLGLLLYEIFLGKRAYDARTVEDLRRVHSEESPSTPSSILTDIDPAVERVILRCLEKNPAERPRTVRDVALALPGGDPLAAALAAGETPAPEIVAASRGGSILPLWVAIACFVGFLGLLALAVAASDRSALMQRVALENSPSVLEKRAREILERIGFGEMRGDAFQAFRHDDRQLAYLAERDASRDRWESLPDTRPAPLRFVYRQSPEPLVPERESFFSLLRMDLDDPPHVHPGMVRVELDATGNLLALSVVPPVALPRGGEGALAPAADFDWSVLFREAGLDPGDFHSVPPGLNPGVYARELQAWEGRFGNPELPVRVEGGSLGGRPVSWRIVFPWEAPNASEEAPGLASAPATSARAELLPSIGFVLLTLLAFAGGAAMAHRNLRLRRGDRRGAFRIAVVSFLAAMLTWILAEHHVAAFAEYRLFLTSLVHAGFMSFLLWISYLALEPTVRREWPTRIVSWVRLLEGRIRDPLVGRDLMFAGILGVSMTLMEFLQTIVCRSIGVAPPRPDEFGAVFVQEVALRGGRQMLALFPGSLQAAMGNALVIIVCLVVLRALFRSDAIAVAGVLVTLTLLEGGTAGAKPGNLIVGFLWASIWIVVLLRFGILPALGGMWVHFVTSGLPLTFDASRWYAGGSALALALVVGVVAWGFWSALGGRPVLADFAGRNLAASRAK